MKYLNYNEDRRGRDRDNGSDPAVKKIAFYKNSNARGSRGKVVCICGSMKFYDTMIAEQLRLVKNGIVALLPVIVSKDDADNFTEEEREFFGETHLQKIEMSDEIYVINIDGYVGKRTALEISYAARMGKIITFMETDE